MVNIYPYVEQGDIEGAVVQWLTDSTEIQDFPDGNVNVSGDFQGYNHADITKRRWIMVTREGGNIMWPVTDKPRIDVQVLAEKRSVALELAQVAQAVIFRAMGEEFPDHGVTIKHVKIETGITRVPDKETGSPRYIFALRLSCIPIFI